MNKNRKKTIYLVSHAYYPEFGGIERLAHRVAIELEKRGDRVKVLTTGRIANKYKIIRAQIRPRYEIVENIQIHALGYLRFFWRIRGLRRIARMLFLADLMIYIYLHRKEARGIVVFAIQHEFACLNLLGWLLPEIPAFGVEGGWGSTFDFRALEKFSFSHFYKNFIRKGLWPIVAFGNRIKSEYVACGFPPSRIRVIPNAVSSPVQMGIYNPDRHNIVCIGRYIPVKGMHILIQAFSHIIQYNVRLLLHGNGPEEKKLSAHANNSGIARFVEFSHSSESIPIESIFSKARLAVIPSLSEGMSTVQLEAMACGMPLIVTDVGCNAEVLGFSESPEKGMFLKNKHGLLILPNDVAALAGALSNIIEQKQLLCAMSNANRQRYEKNYTISKVVDRYLHLLNEKA